MYPHATTHSRPAWLGPWATAAGRLRTLGGLVLALALAAMLAPAPARADDPKARQIMQAVNDRDEGDKMRSQLEMVLIDKGGNKRIRKIQSFSKNKGVDKQSIMFFTEPADVQGTGFLTYDYDESGKDDDQWLYLPALRKSKRIAAGDKSGSFMGSDFNYSDMVAPDLADFDLKLMKETKVDEVMTWQIESVPRSTEIAEETGYSKSIVWVRQDNHVVIRGLRWVHKSNRRKYFQVKDLKQIDGIWVATELQMVTKEGNKTVHATVLNISDVQFNQPLSDADFTVRRLERGL